jgi:hypothetical protein
MCKIKYIYAWSICRATLQFSRTLNLCPEIEKLSVVVIEKFEGAIWLKNQRSLQNCRAERTLQCAIVEGKDVSTITW